MGNRGREELYNWTRLYRLSAAEHTLTTGTFLLARVQTEHIHLLAQHKATSLVRGPSASRQVSAILPDQGEVLRYEVERFICAHSRTGQKQEALQHCQGPSQQKRGLHRTLPATQMRPFSTHVCGVLPSVPGSVHHGLCHIFDTDISVSGLFINLSYERKGKESEAYQQLLPEPAAAASAALRRELAGQAHAE